MPTFIALLRGVNVGKAKRVPMAELRALLSELGYEGVATLLNSGNAVFRSPKGPSSKHASAIAAAIADKLKLDVPVIVKAADELTAIVSENSLAREDVDPSRLLVAFVQDAKSLSTLAPLADLVVPPEELLIGKHAAYVHLSNGILQSKAGEALLGKVGKAATTRNWATVLKLQALASERR